MLFNREKNILQGLREYEPPIPQTGRTTTFHYKNDAFIHASRLLDETYMHETEKVLLADNCKKTTISSKASVYQVTPKTRGNDFQFAILVSLDTEKLLFLCEDKVQFIAFTRKWMCLMPWIKSCLPSSVTQLY